jgi:transposase
MSNALMNEREAAERLGVTIFCLRKWRARRVGPAWVKLTDNIGSGVRYDIVDLNAWIESRKQRTRTMSR